MDSNDKKIINLQLRLFQQLDMEMQVKSIHMYHNDAEILDRHVWANPDQSAQIRIYTICYSVCTFLKHYWLFYLKVHPQYFAITKLSIMTREWTVE